MEISEILLKGNFTEKDVLVTLSPSTRKMDQVLEKHLTDKWEEILNDARNNNKQIWESETYRLNKIEAIEGKIYLDLGIVPFSTRISMKHFKEEVNTLGRDYFSMGLFVCALIKTLDNKYVFGELSTKTLNTNKYDLIGGVLSKDEMAVKNGANLFGFIYKEVMEEINIAESDIRRSSLIGSILNDKFQVALIFDLELSLDSTEVVNKFNERNDGEMKGIRIVEPKDLSIFLISLENWKYLIDDLR